MTGVTIQCFYNSRFYASEDLVVKITEWVITSTNFIMLSLICF